MRSRPGRREATADKCASQTRGNRGMGAPLRVSRTHSSQSSQEAGSLVRYWSAAGSSATIYATETELQSEEARRILNPSPGL